jgi:hypothetical protein
MGGVVTGRWRVPAAWLRGRVMLGVVTAMATVGLSVFGAVGSAQAATNTQWNVAYKGHAAGLYDVTAISKTDAWAVGTTGSGIGQRPQFMHWDGKAWSVYGIHNITKFSPMSVKATAANNVWAFGYNDGDIDDNPYALIFNGSSWRSMKLPEGFDPAQAVVGSSTNVWGVTNQSCTVTGQSRCTVLARWNGSAWSSVTVGGEVVSVNSVGGHVFFLALINMKFYSNGLGIGAPVISEPTTKMWEFPGPNLQITDSGAGLAVELNGQRYLMGELTYGSHPMRLYHEVGSTWSTVSIPANVCPSGMSGYCPLTVGSPLTYDGVHGFWSGYGAHYTGSGWVNTGYFGPSFFSVSSSGFAANIEAVGPIPGSSSAWGVGAIAPGTASTDWVYTLVAVNGPRP